MSSELPALNLMQTCNFYYSCIYKSVISVKASLVAELVKNLPAMQETWIQSLGWEDPLEKGKATLSSILPWKTP